MNYEELDSLIRGKNVNFLIGAGASVPLYPSLSFGDGYPTFEDIVSNNKISKESKLFMYLYYFKKWIAPMGISNIDFQKKYSQDEVYGNYKKLVNILYNYLQVESNEAPKRINIFSTNYDLLFERAIDEFLFYNPLIYFNDGSRGVFKKYVSNKNYYLNVTHSGYNDNYRREVPTINLFKLHGSISWGISSDRIIVNENNGKIDLIREIIRKIGLSDKDINDIIDRAKNKDIDTFVQNINDVISNSQLDINILSEFYKIYKDIPIINPNKYKFFKTVSEQHYYQLIRSFSYELEKKQSVLIIFGFSFADEHLRDIFERSLLNPELQVLLISYSKDGQNKLKDMFRGYKNINFLPENFENSKGDFSYLLSLFGDLNE